FSTLSERLPHHLENPEASMAGTSGKGSGDVVGGNTSAKSLLHGIFLKIDIPYVGPAESVTT
ncbi:MAG: hypothetical protein WBD30_13210, partial [Bacteroidota bacterium]